MRKLIARIVPAAACILLAICAAGAARAEAPRTQCDVEASHTADVSPLAPIVEWEKLDGYRALGACTQAIETYPTSGRLMALLSRAYSKLQDHDNAFKWARRSAEIGSPLGVYQLGIAYTFGEGVAKDPEMAFLYMRKAGEAGLSAGHYNVADAYRKGDGVARDIDEAIAYNERAAAGGYARAHFVLGEIYEKGEKGTKSRADLERARSHYEKARDGGVKIGDALARVETALASAAPSPAPAAPQEETPEKLAEEWFWLQVASRQDYHEAVEVAAGYRKTFEATKIYRSRNGWYAIVVGTVRKGNIEATISDLAGEGRIPKDSYATRGESFVAKVWPSDPPPAAEAPPKIAAAPKVVEDEAPAPASGPPPAIEQTAQEAFSLDTRFIAAGEYGALEAAAPAASRLGGLPIIRTARDTYVVVVAHGPEAKIAALYDRMRRNGELPDAAGIVDGRDFVRHVFPDKK